MGGPRGSWRLPEEPSDADLEREWAELVEPVLPRVQEKLWANLLLAEIWDRVLDERARRMLYRMTLLRRPWEWKLAAVLGEEGEGEKVRLSDRREAAQDFAAGGGGARRSPRAFTLHPATAQFVHSRFGDNEALRRVAHRRLGDYLEAEAQTSHWSRRASKQGIICSRLASTTKVLSCLARSRNGCG